MAKKEEVVKRQKKNKKKNKKGLAAFMENDGEADAFKEDKEGDENDDKPVSQPSKEENEPVKKTSAISRTLDEDEVLEDKTSGDKITEEAKPYNAD